MALWSGNGGFIRFLSRIMAFPSVAARIISASPLSLAGSNVPWVTDIVALVPHLRRRFLGLSMSDQTLNILPWTVGEGCFRGTVLQQWVSWFPENTVPQICYRV